MIGAEHILSARAATPEVGKRVIKIVKDVEESANSMHVDLRGTQPTPENIEGGLSTIEEKSMGCLAKAGTSKVAEVEGTCDNGYSGFRCRVRNGDGCRRFSGRPLHHRQGNAGGISPCPRDKDNRQPKRGFVDEGEH